MHTGIDIQGGYGDNILSAFDGVVVFAGQKSGYGNVIYINSEVNGRKIQARFAHLKDASIKVLQDSIVSSGEIIGEMGNTGDTVGGALLHFELLESTNGADCEIDGTNTINVEPLRYGRSGASL